MTTRIYDGCVASLESKDSYYNADDLHIKNIHFDSVHLKFEIEFADQYWLTRSGESINIEVFHDSAYLNGVTVTDRNGASNVSVHLITQSNVERLKSNIFEIKIIYNSFSSYRRKPFVFKSIPITIDVCGISTYQGNISYILTKTTVMNSNSTNALDEFNDIRYYISLEGNTPYKETIYDKVNRGLMLLKSRSGTGSYQIQIDYRTTSESFYSMTTKPFKMVFNDYMVENNTLNLDYLSAYINIVTGKVTMVLPEVYSGGFGSVYLSNYNTKVFYLRNQFPTLLDFFDESAGFIIPSSYELFSKTVYSDADMDFERMEATGISFVQKTDPIINAVGFVISVTPNNSDYAYPQTFIMDQRNLSLINTLAISQSALYTIASGSSIIGSYRLLTVARSSELPTIPLKFISKGDIDVYRDKLFLAIFNSYLNTSAQPEQLALYLTNDGKETLARGDIEQGTAIKNLLNPITTRHLKSLFPDLPVGSNVSDKIQYNFALQLGNQNNTTNPVWVILEEYGFGTVNFDFYEIKQLALEITYAKDFVDNSYIYETKTYDFDNTGIEESQNILISKKSVINISFSCDDYVLDSGKFQIRTASTDDNSHGSMVNAKNSSVASPNFNNMIITGKLELATAKDPSILFTPIYPDGVRVQFRFRSLKNPIVTTEIYQGLPMININTVESEFDIESSLITIETDHYTWSKQVVDTRVSYEDLFFMDLFEDNKITVTQYTDEDTGLASDPVNITWGNFLRAEEIHITNPIMVLFDTANNKALPFILDKDPDINTTVSYPNSTTIQEFNTNSPFVIHDNLKEIKTSISFTIIKGWHKYFNLPESVYGNIWASYGKTLSGFLNYFRDNYQKYLVMIARPDHYSLFGEIIDSSITRSTDNSYTIKMTHLATNDTAKLKEIGVTLKNEG